MKFRRKPTTVEAFRIPLLGASEDDYDGFLEWTDEVALIDYVTERDGTVSVRTLNGWVKAEPGEWIIKGVKGEFYPCKADIFEETYEPA